MNNSQIISTAMAQSATDLGCAPEDFIKDKNIISVTYFIKDEKKDGGRYENYSGIIKRINNVEEYIKFEDNKIINFNDILSVDGEVFNSFSIYE